MYICTTLACACTTPNQRPLQSYCNVEYFSREDVYSLFSIYFQVICWWSHCVRRQPMTWRRGLELSERRGNRSCNTWARHTTVVALFVLFLAPGVVDLFAVAFLLRSWHIINLQFIETAKEICARLSSAGLWADFIDPYSGRAVHDTEISYTFALTLPSHPLPLLSFPASSLLSPFLPTLSLSLSLFSPATVLQSSF